MADFKRGLKRELRKLGEGVRDDMVKDYQRVENLVRPSDDLKREREERRRKRELTMRSTAVFEGGSQPINGLKVGSQCVFTLTHEGVTISTAIRAIEKLSISWSEIVRIEAEDASRTEIRTGVQQRAAGGIWSPIGTTAPVAKVRSKFVGQSFVVIAAGARGEFLFRVMEEAKKVEGRLLQTRELRPPTPESASQQEQSDPLVQLEGLARLRDAGVISHEDFESKKTEILRRI